MSFEILEIIDVGNGWNRVRLADGNIYTLDGTYAWRSNNPGNIEYGPFAISQGAIGEGAPPPGRKRGFAIFPTLAAGQHAREALQFQNSSYLNADNSGQYGHRYPKGSIGAAIYRYAPPNENDTEGYITAVTRATGTSGYTLLSDLSAEQRAAFLEAQQRHEGFKVGDVYNAKGVKLPPGEIPNLVASQLDTAAPKVAPVPQPRSQATVARLNASFAAPRPVTKSAALAAQQAGGGGGTDAPQKQAYVPGPERRLPIVGPTGDQRRDDLGSMPSAGEMARFNGARAALRPGADIALSAERNAATPVLAEEGVYTHHIPDQTVTTVQRGLGSLTPDAVETTLPNPPLRGIPGSNGLVAQEAPGAPKVSQQAGAGGKSAPVPRPASDRPAEPISSVGERRLPVIRPTGDQRVDPVGSMPSAGQLSQLKRQQAAPVPQRLVGEEAAAPKAVSPKPGVMRITSPDKSGAAGNAALPMDTRPAVADSLVKSAAEAQKRAALTSMPQTYAGQERAVGLAPKKAAAAAPSKADPVGLFPSKEDFNHGMGLPNYPNGVPSMAEMEKRQAAGKSGIAAKANAVLDATAPATAKSAADVPKYLTVTEKVPVKPKPTTANKVPLGEMTYQGSRDALAQAEQGRKDAETIQFRTVTRKVINPDYVDPQQKPANNPSAKASGTAGKTALAPDGEAGKDLNLLQKGRQAVGLPIDGLGPGFLKALQNGFGLGTGKAKAGGKPIVLSAEQIAQAKANPQDHNPAALAAISQGQTSYVSSDGSVQPTVSMSGGVRKTYGD